MYPDNLVRVHFIERKLTARARLENFPMSEPDRFRLRVKVNSIRQDKDGSLVFWIDKADVNSLHLDCSTALLDDDIATGVIDCNSMVGS